MRNMATFVKRLLTAASTLGLMAVAGIAWVGADVVAEIEVHVVEEAPASDNGVGEPEVATEESEN